MANTKVTSAVIADNAVGIDQLNVSDGTNGQVLTTNGSGTLSFSTISGYTDSDVETYLNTSAIYTDATNNRVGIGTSSPSNTLTLSSGTNDGRQLKLYGTSNNALIKFDNFDTAQEYSMGLNGSAFIVYDDTNSAYRLTLSSTGNLAIGATSPSAKLDVRGVSNFGDQSNAIVYVSTPSSSEGRIGVGGRTSVVPINMTFWTADGGANYERMRIHSAGGFSVANSSTVGTFYNGASTGFGYDSGLYCGIVRSGTNTPLYVSTTGTGAGGFIEFYQATSVRGNITFNGSSTLYNATSDYRLKENVVELPNALERVSQLNPVQFDWIESGISSEGFLAHEAQAVVPYSVTGQQDELYTKDNAAEEQINLIGQPKYQTMDYGKLTPLLVKAIQEQQTIIDDLKARIETLENA